MPGAHDKGAALSREEVTTRVSIFGLGYVGAVTAGCLADRGFTVVGVDVNETKVKMLNGGRAPIIEEKIGEIIKRGRDTGKLRATCDIAEAVEHTDVSLICVGTPSKPNGDLELDYVKRVAEQIGAELARKKSYHTVIVRSTILPGTTDEIVKPILEKASGKRAGEDFGLCFNPEFLREASSVKDFYEPPFTLVGVTCERDAEAVRELYGWLDAEFIVVDIRTAEMVKYINNSYHGLKVAFGNEVGRLCAALGIDSHRVMEIFCKDTKQNLSSYYLKPGYAFGGSCLPKDLRAILYKAKTLDVPMEVFESVLPSNRTQIEQGIELVERAGSKNVGLLGLSFKAGTDDMRESPLVALVETLLGRGYKVKIFDSHVSMSKLFGANKQYIEQEIPHIGNLLCKSLDDVINDCDTIVIGNPAPEFRDALQRIPQGKRIIDLVRIVDNLSDLPEGYEGIGW
ncbi:MAG TPA: nucleotide sugar dehydrogenase [candidate division Zixibacteria bacterium]|nr:nucleotide sugar dehydrogenase [candidate division Zixibacteria bacterium]